MMRGVRRGCVRLKAAVVGIDDQDDCTFTISVDHKTFHFQTKNARDREHWISALEDTIRRHSLKVYISLLQIDITHKLFKLS